MADGPIISLIDHSKFKAFQDNVIKFKKFKALIRSYESQGFLRVSMPCTDPARMH